MAEDSQSIFNEFAAPLSYVGLFITGLFFMVVTKDEFVRFHAKQSVVVFVSLIALQAILGYVPVVSRLVPLVTILTFVLWLVLIYKSWMGDKWEVPVLGALSTKFFKDR